MATEKQGEFLTTSEALIELDISHRALWVWTHRLGIKKYKNPMDKRERLFARADIERIRNRHENKEYIPVQGITGGTRCYRQVFSKVISR